MSFYECYCDECKSEADEIIEEARDKLVDLITEQANSEISAILDNNKRLVKTNEALRQTIESLEKERDVLKTDLDKTKRELVLSGNINPQYQIGEVAYYMKPSRWETIKCPICNGTGCIKVNDSAFGTLTANCPHCSGSNYGRRNVEYCIRKVEYGYVTSIKIILDAKSGEAQYSYKISSSMSNEPCTDYITELYETKDMAQAAVNKRNAEEEEKARRKVNGEEEQ